MSGSHPHDHDHDHDHLPITDDDEPVRSYEVLEMAVRELLIEKGVLTAADVPAQIEATNSRNPALGAEIVARAWNDPAYKSALIENPRSTLAEQGLDVGRLAELTVVENTPGTHHVVVCTLCSCYPRMILGAPPAWYKSSAYRSRVVRDPRGVLQEFGVEIPDDSEVRVLDSTADLRYLVIPRRPAGTEGWSAEALADLVTRDSMIGTGLAKEASAD